MKIRLDVFKAVNLFSVIPAQFLENSHIWKKRRRSFNSMGRR